MAKSKKRKKVQRREKGASRSSGGDGAKKSSGSRKGGGAMMGMRSGFKGVAGSLVGKQAKSKKTRRAVDVFWWIVTIVLGAVAVYFLYNRFGR